ncbi:hypothetical protein [Gordonia rhizosphera]|uniref:Uncharacterized protein n=1 Tax=Gordonia rhizosphera NBRC 16068 TaxID=1108045 RepID=K6W6G8_9ACTN|nr:hypothetical protein [Gordonia rhizosphera]GAB89281.1 hypothetical protein GORHZ_055_00650 [Gordonia rhizosphera NBRC 16068]
MRKLTVTVAATAVIAAGAGITAALVDPSPTAAAPNHPSTPCGDFDGFGPEPDCSYRTEGTLLTVTVRNRGVSEVPVVCTLGLPNDESPDESVTLGPQERGELSTRAFYYGWQSFAVDCQSDTSRAKEVSRRVVFLAMFSMEATTSSSPTRYVPSWPRPTPRTSNPTPTSPSATKPTTATDTTDLTTTTTPVP